MLRLEVQEAHLLRRANDFGLINGRCMRGRLAAADGCVMMPLLAGAADGRMPVPWRQPHVSHSTAV